MSRQVLSAEDFAAKMREYGQKTVQLIAKNVAVAAFTGIATNVIQTTPILTGRARNNWQPSVDSPAEGEVHGGTIQDKARHAEEIDKDLTGAPLTGQEKAGIKRATDQFLKTESATRLYLTNNLSYIKPLDEGSSGKAPAGIVEPSIHASLAVLQDRGVK